MVLTDYPDEDLIENLRHNVREVHALHQHARGSGRLKARGYLWGDANVAPLYELLPLECQRQKGFDILLLADLNFNHHCHEALAATICLILKWSKDARALVFFTPYRPWLLDKDMALFAVCGRKGLVVKKLLEEQTEQVMFEKDLGDETLRKTVFGYEISWSFGEEVP